ncbi:hypothetical protein DFJ74DRAFT_654301 [Hyaloraphidium curvatum]|nr:hypothetical protein DFJ74DRAFT_654301 [Hyaloraphidium curvatum]
MDSAKELLRLWDADRTELAALRASKAEKEALLRTLERVVEEEERVVQEKERIVEKTERIIEEKEHIVQEKERIVEKTERIIEESAFLHTMARCSGQQAAVSRAIESGNAGALEKLARSEAQSMVDLYSYLCEGIHNPRGVHFLPIARGDRTRACQLRALADKFNVEAREVDSADVGFEKLYAPVPGDPADSDK